MKKILLGMLMVVLLGCECKYQEERCEEGVFQSCTWKGKWETVLTLGDISPDVFYCEGDKVEYDYQVELFNYKPFNSRHIDKDFVVAFWNHLSEVYGTKTKRRKTKHVVSGKALLVGDTIYLPFEIGVVSDGHDLVQQVLIAVHEHQHYVSGFSRAKYMFSSSYRAKEETNAFLANLDLRNIFGLEKNLDMMWLKSEYKCFTHDALFGELVVKYANMMYKYGNNVTVTEVGEEAYEFTKEYFENKEKGATE